MARYIIDAAGNPVPNASRALRALFESDVPEIVLRDPAVSEGFVRIDNDGHRTRIFMRTDIATRPTLTELLHWLHGSATKSAVLYDPGYTPCFQPRGIFEQWLQTQLAAKAPSKSAYLSRRISREASMLASLAEAFLDIAGRTSRLEEIVPICNAMFKRRYTITSLQGDRQTMVIRSLGHGYSSFDRRWTDMACGCRPQDGPDYHYGLWVGETHCRALLTNRLLFDDVDAIIGRPQLPPMRVTYTRCVVPFRLRKDPCYVLSASAARDDIDLRC